MSWRPSAPGPVRVLSVAVVLIAAGLPFCVSTCTDNTCLHGGKCTAEGVCDCADGWKGPDCALDVDANVEMGGKCLHGTCLHGGTCNVNNVCECVDGWHGPDCALHVDAVVEIGGKCLHGTCLHGGTCNADGVCKCTAGWNGPDCALDDDGIYVGESWNQYSSNSTNSTNSTLGRRYEKDDKHLALYAGIALPVAGCIFVATRLKQELNLGGDIGADIEMADGMKTKIMHDGDI